VVHRLVEQLKALDELETIRAEASRARAEAEQATAQAQQATAEAEQATVQAEHARAEGVARSILTVLSGRGMPVSEQARERILACRDLDVLHDWLRRALTIDGTDELFDATQ
jgi:phage terminase Nu1 subunit (DNA packaging protein)